MKIGRYRHYKGNEYEVTGFAIHSETFERLVVYKPLGTLPDDVPDFDYNTFWVRPLSLFEERVTVEGKERPRFNFIS